MIRLCIQRTQQLLALPLSPTFTFASRSSGLPNSWIFQRGLHVNQGPSWLSSLPTLVLVLELCLPDSRMFHSVSLEFWKRAEWGVCVCVCTPPQRKSVSHLSFPISHPQQRLLSYTPLAPSSRLCSTDHHFGDSLLGWLVVSE